MVITTADLKVAEGLEQELFEPIAVIGLGALMSDAKDIDAFWQNITQGKVRSSVNLTLAGQGRRLLKTGGPGDVEEGFTYSKIGAFVEGFELVPMASTAGDSWATNRVNYGQLKSQQQHLSSLAMMENRKTLTVQNAE